MMFNDLTIKMIVSIVRYIIISIGSILVAKKIIPEELFDAWASEAALAAAGVVMIVLTLGWRYLNVRFEELTKTKLSQAPPAETATESKIAIREAQTEVAAEHRAVTSI